MAQITNYKGGHRYADGKPGLYVCFSSFVIDGVVYRIEEECRNPEVGRRALYERECELLRELGAPTKGTEGDEA